MESRAGAGKHPGPPGVADIRTKQRKENLSTVLSQLRRQDPKSLRVLYAESSYQFRLLLILIRMATILCFFILKSLHLVCEYVCLLQHHGVVKNNFLWTVSPFPPFGFVFSRQGLAVCHSTVNPGSTAQFCLPSSHLTEGTRDYRRTLLHPALALWRQRQPAWSKL